VLTFSTSLLTFIPMLCKYMKKHYPSKLDPFADQLDHWFGVENMTLAQARERLRELGCDVSLNNLAHWCRVRRRQQCQEQLLHDISSGAQQCEQVEKEFAEAAAPNVETLLKLQRVLILQLSTQASADPQLIKLVNQSMRPVLEHAQQQSHEKLIERREQSREKLVAIQDRRAVVLEEKFRLVKEEQARLEAERSTPEEPGGLSPENIKKIRESLNLH
jgi:hypothetical protein